MDGVVVWVLALLVPLGSAFFVAQKLHRGLLPSKKRWTILFSFLGFVATFFIVSLAEAVAVISIVGFSR